MVTLYLAILLAVAAERAFELHLSRRNAAAARARGGLEFGRGHYPVMVGLHTAFLAACAAEVLLLDRPFRLPLFLAMLALVLAAQALRYAAVRALGPAWNTRVIVVPGAPAARSGPYRRLRHPNYLAVVLEVAALPLLHGAWLTALSFSVLNGALLAFVRIPCEERALRQLRGWDAR